MGGEAAMASSAAARDSRAGGTLGRELAVFALPAAVLALICVWPVLTSGTRLGVHDWDHDLFNHAVPRDTLVVHRQMPLWNPYACGGLPLLANPQTRVLSPSMVLLAALGTVNGIKLDILLHYFIGLLGGYAAARALGAERVSAALGGVVFTISTAYAMHLAEGHTSMLPAALMPWVLWSLVRSFDDLRYTFLTGALLALILFDGGHYILPITALFVSAYCALHLFSTRWRRAAVVLGLTGACAVGLAAIKLLPAAELTRAYPRPGHPESGITLEVLYRMLLEADQRPERIHDFGPVEGAVRGMLDGMHENAMYVGWIGLALGVLGMAVCAARQWRLIVCAALALWLCFGSHVSPSLSKMVYRLPGLDNMSSAPRFRFVLLLLLGMFAALGLSRVRRSAARVLRVEWAATCTAAVILLLVYADMVRAARPGLAWAFSIPAPTLDIGGPREAGTTFRQIERLPCYGRAGYRPTLYWFEESGSRDVPFDVTFSSMLPAYWRNEGTIRAYEPLPIRVYAVPEGSARYRGEVYLSRGSGTARYAEWTPNRLRVAVEARRADEVVINQNFDAGWRAVGAASGARANVSGLLSAAVDAGTREVTFLYRPTSFVVGAWISAGTVVICVGALGFLGGGEPRAV